VTEADGLVPDEAYQRDPIGWMRDVLQIPEHTLRWSMNPGYATHRWDGTPDPLVLVCEALADWQDAGMESGTGTGKSFLGGALVLWFLACWRHARAFTFAPKEEQLRKFIWKEIGVLWPRFKARFPTAILNDLELLMDGASAAADAWGAWGYAVGVRAGEDSATKAQGMHAEHMLLVYEETPGIPPAVLTAGENTCTAPHNLRLALGNPDHQQDALHQFCTAQGVTHVRVSALDHPNVVTGDASVVPGAVSQKAVDRRLAKYGTGSRLYESRVRGVCPAESEDALIKLEWCRAAAQKWTDARFRVGAKALGVDVANSENGDSAAVAMWQGATLLKVDAFACPNANQLGRDVLALGQTQYIDPAHVGIDSVGVGSGTVNTCWDEQFRVQALNGAGSPLEGAAKGYQESEREWQSDVQTFNNLRSQMWWQMREDLRMGRVALPADEELFRELTMPVYKLQGGKVVVEGKPEIRKRLGRSPDKGDAVVYGNWVRPRVDTKRGEPGPYSQHKSPGFDKPPGGAWTRRRPDLVNPDTPRPEQQPQGVGVSYRWQGGSEGQSV
jgi:phage terminase large subunit